MIVGKTQFALRAQHSLRAHAADNCCLKRRRVLEAGGAMAAAAVSAADKPCTQAREGRDHPGPHVGRAANDAETADRARVDVAQIEPVGIGMALDLEYTRHEDVTEARRRALDVLDLQPGERQAAAQLVDVGLQRDELGEPTERQLHDDGLVAAVLAAELLAVEDLAMNDGNCPRKRRSFSKNSRMSSTPSLSSACRSTPIPN